MPMYEYHCKTCDETIEVLMRHGQPEPVSCGEDCAHSYGPDMGQGEVARLDFSVTGGHVLGANRPASVGKADPYCGVCGKDELPTP